MRWSLLILCLYLLAAVLTGFGMFVPAIDLADMQADVSPNSGAWFGTDHLGRDVFAQTVQGSRVALSVGSLAAGLAVILGALFGILAGWYGGRLDALILWLSGSVAAIPGILLILLLSWMLGGGYIGVFLAVGLVSWVGIYRLVRVEVQRLRQEPFVLSSQSFGARFPNIAWRHLLPNLGPLLATQFLLHFLFAVKAEVILSFLGIGMQGHTSWGTMIADAWAFDDLGQDRWWRLTAATGAMALLILAMQRVAMRRPMRSA
ncbi:MAG: ABC transporter permease [Planctomycetota bacterium]|jgi:peptide/nickel transport system permease protein